MGLSPPKTLAPIWEVRILKITALETIRLEEFPNLLWLQVHTDEGLIGLGETFFGPRAVAAYIHESAAPRLLGQDPLLIDRHSRMLLDGYLGFSGSGAEMRGLSAIDIALWDIFGQAVGKPIHQCLGGLARESIRTYNTCAGYRYVRGAAGAGHARTGGSTEGRAPTRISTPSSTVPTSSPCRCSSRASPA